jgi:replicative DNA helicase
MKDSLLEVLRTIEDKPKSPTKFSAFTPGIKYLCSKFMNLDTGSLIVIAGRAGMGKSSLALNIISEVAKQTNDAVVIFSYEMPHIEMAEQLVASEARIKVSKFRQKDFTDEELKKVSGAIQTISNWPLLIEDSGIPNVIEIYDICEKIKMQSGLSMILIDGLQKVPIRKSKRENAVKSLKDIAAQLNIPIIVTTHIRRPKKKIERKPKFKDLEDFYPLAFYADYVLFTHRDDFFNPESEAKGIAEIQCYNNRRAASYVFSLRWIGSQCRFEDL